MQPNITVAQVYVRLDQIVTDFISYRMLGFLSPLNNRIFFIDLFEES